MTNPEKHSRGTSMKPMKRLPFSKEKFDSSGKAQNKYAGLAM